MKILLEETNKYVLANSDKNIQNPVTFVAAIGIEMMTSLVRKANETNKILEFSYKGRKLEWKFQKAENKFD